MNKIAVIIVAAVLTVTVGTLVAMERSPLGAGDPPAEYFEPPNGPIDLTPFYRKPIEHCAAGTDKDYRRTISHFHKELEWLSETIGKIGPAAEQLGTRPSRPPTKGRPPAKAEAIKEMAGLSSEIGYHLRSFLPIDEYPNAIHGWGKMLRDGEINLPRDHDGEQGVLKVMEGAFTLSMYELAPQSRVAAGEFVEAVEILFSMTETESRTMSANPAVPLEIKNQAKDVQALYPAFLAIVEQTLAHPDYPRVIARSAYGLCKQ
ncbi:hypothetical protein [Sphingorhabdus sp. SMR4y]|uniref:hypothetical protein n=1 Tax=Sphingorhabdus sp. SMR4y TaxID=2584094 RepID=UPI000B5C34D1|nr:hypothetical protein [Sphingorhabdus sp. SMR4y]ASK89831.1 hypothetical protein SPHFLASMR4Y_03099 [Sphingorhabdus sp. SMR4y]